MALVGYTYSDESEDEPDDSDHQALPINTNGKISVSAAPVGRSAQTSSSLSSGSVSTATDLVEPEYRMRMPATGATNKPSLLPGITRLQSGRSGRILLNIPSIDELEASSDDDDDLGTNNRRRPVIDSRQESRPGLLSMLPAPQALIVRQGSKPIIPHQVIRRPPTTTSSHPQSASGKSTDQLTSKASTNKDDVDSFKGDSSSSSEDESSVDNHSTANATNFFSFGTEDGANSSGNNDEAVVEARRAAALASSLNQPTSTSVEPPSTSAASSSIRLSIISDSVLASARQEATSSQLPDSSSDLPLPLDPDDDEPVVCWTADTFVPGPERKRFKLSSQGGADPSTSNTIDRLLSAPSTNIRSVAQSDLTEGADLALIKSVTSDEGQYMSKRAKDENDPGRLAHQKHQITWLAHQAEVNEIEMQNRWADARRNKASNRAKYGF